VHDKTLTCLLSVFAVLLVSAIAGCTTTPDPEEQVESTMSMREAQHRIYGYFEQTLRELPMEVSLSRTPGSAHLGAFRGRMPGAVPCWSGNVQSEGPRYLDVSYWIVGIPAGGTREYFERILQNWQARGWEETSRDEVAGAVRTGDGFGLKLQDAGKGDGSLSLTGFSPCVPEETEDSLEPLPDVFPHP